MQTDTVDYRILFECNPTPICIINEEGLIGVVNTAFVTLMGGDCDTWINQHFFDALHPQELARIHAELKVQKGKSETVYVHSKFRHHNGEFLEIRWSTSYIKENKSSIIKLRLLTNQEREERALNRVFKSVIKSSTDALIFADLDGVVYFSNEFALKLFKYSNEDMLNLNISKLLHEPDSLSEEIIPALKETGKWSGTPIHIDAGGETFPALIVIQILFDSVGHPSTLYVRVKDLRRFDQAGLEPGMQNINQRDFVEILEERVKQRTEEIEKQKEIIEYRTKKMTDSINYAKRIQDLILPPMSRVKKLLGDDTFIMYRPKDIVSGDFYWLNEVNDKIIFAAVDCTGHGVPGAFMSVIGKDILDEIVVKNEMVEPGEILFMMHLKIVNLLQQRTSANRDGMDMGLCVIDKKANTVSFAGARNPMYYMMGGEQLEVKASKQSIGLEFGSKDAVTDLERDYRSETIHLDGEACFYIFSDGLQDQFGGERGRKFSKRRVKELIKEHHDKPMKEQEVLFNKALDDWKGDAGQIDDILFIGFHLKPSSEA